MRCRANPFGYSGAGGCSGLWLALVVVLTTPHAVARERKLAPSTMPRLGSIDARFLSYNIEMVRVTGGPFWKPYGPETSAAQTAQPAARSTLYADQPPIDLASPRLRMLAAALAPAYLRVSGTWANATYFADTDTLPSALPAGFDGVLTRRQWRGVVDFSRAVDAPLVTSFAASPGTRDTAGVWMPDQARRLLAFSRVVGGRIAAVEFINEPDLAATGDSRQAYSAAAFGRDFAIFRDALKQAAPETLILAPGTVTETPAVSALFAASAPGADAVSYHSYGALSERCAGTATREAALSEDWLSRTDRALAFYKELRDRLAPGKPIWLTETAQAACGGDRWAATFIDTFRYLDQLGRLAKAGVQVVMHNTLAASDYGLLDERTLTPRPNYWGALLWRKLIGSTVLDAGIPIESGLHVYAHCLREMPGGVALLVINNDRAAAQTLTLPDDSERYTLDATRRRDDAVRLNGRTLELTDAEALPRIAAVPASAGVVTFAPATITFLALPIADNAACR